MGYKRKELGARVAAYRNRIGDMADVGFKDSDRVKSVKKYIETSPTAKNKEAAQRANQAYREYRNKKIVYNSKLNPVWGAPKPPIIVDGKRVSSYAGQIGQASKPIIRSTATGTGVSPRFNSLGQAVDNLAKSRRLPTPTTTPWLETYSTRKAAVAQNMSRLQGLQAKSLGSKAYKVASTLGKAGRVLGKAAGPVGVALTAYDAIKAIDKYSNSAMAKSQMAKYKQQGGFSHMTSNPNKRGKEGIDW